MLLAVRPAPFLRLSTSPPAWPRHPFPECLARPLCFLPAPSHRECRHRLDKQEPVVVVSHHFPYPAVYRSHLQAAFRAAFRSRLPVAPVPPLSPSPVCRCRARKDSQVARHLLALVGSLRRLVARQVIKDVNKKRPTIFVRAVDGLRTARPDNVLMKTAALTANTTSRLYVVLCVPPASDTMTKQLHRHQESTGRHMESRVSPRLLYLLSHRNGKRRVRRGRSDRLTHPEQVKDILLRSCISSESRLGIRCARIVLCVSPIQIVSLAGPLDSQYITMGIALVVISGPIFVKGGEAILECNIT
ncbi:hypothetical protein GGS20DRAFT_440114 [Poronia punctata]|nr:hypothetical protein GGS20DRAFT_440114 [Poronia punctata]